jgi:hypothetical protein
MEDDEEIGMEKKLKLGDVMGKLSEIPKLQLIIMMGQKMRMLKEIKEEKKWMNEVKVPILGVHSFDIESDNYGKKILEMVYKKLFQRKREKMFE